MTDGKEGIGDPERMNIKGSICRIRFMNNSG
jgi:hypothetical protein